MLVISSIISLFFILTLISICEDVNYSGSLDWMITLSVILILILNLLIFGFYNYSQKRNEEFTALQLRLQKEEYHVQYQKMLLQEDENQKILIHDIRNHLQTISTLNNNGESEKLNSYITEIVNSSDLQTTARVSDNDLLNSILARYIRQCQENQTTFYLDIRKNSTTFLSDKDITSLFCNLLDNAMEAVVPLPSAFIDLSVIYKKDLSMSVITLINSCRSDPFSGKGNRLISTKTDPGRHGFGLKSIKNITDKYNGETNMYYDKNNKTFHTILTLYHNHVSTRHPRMSMPDRAAQFSPFALTGYGEVIRETARLTDRKPELSESEKAELDYRLQMACDFPGECPVVTITYFVPDQKKTGGAYHSISGKIQKIDDYEKQVVLDDKTRIDIDCILDIDGDIYARTNDGEMDFD